MPRRSDADFHAFLRATPAVFLAPSGAAPASLASATGYGRQHAAAATIQKVVRGHQVRQWFTDELNQWEATEHREEEERLRRVAEITGARPPIPQPPRPPPQLAEPPRAAKRATFAPGPPGWGGAPPPPPPGAPADRQPAALQRWLEELEVDRQVMIGDEEAVRMERVHEEALHFTILCRELDQELQAMYRRMFDVEYQETYLRRKLEEAEALGRQMAATSCAQRVARDGEERRVVAREEAAARQAIEVAQMVEAQERFTEPFKRLRYNLYDFSALQVQRVWRGSVVRYRLRLQFAVLEMNLAAVRIQRIWRGYLVRAAYWLLQDVRVRHMAAVRLQRVYRGHLARVLYREALPYYRYAQQAQHAVEYKASVQGTLSTQQAAFCDKEESERHALSLMEAAARDVLRHQLHTTSLAAMHQLQFAEEEADGRSALAGIEEAEWSCLVHYAQAQYAIIHGYKVAAAVAIQKRWRGCCGRQAVQRLWYQRRMAALVAAEAARRAALGRRHSRRTQWLTFVAHMAPGAAEEGRQMAAAEAVSVRWAATGAVQVVQRAWRAYLPRRQRWAARCMARAVSRWWRRRSVRQHAALLEELHGVERAELEQRIELLVIATEFLEQVAGDCRALRQQAYAGPVLRLQGWWRGQKARGTLRRYRAEEAERRQRLVEAEERRAAEREAEAQRAAASLAWEAQRGRCAVTLQAWWRGLRVQRHWPRIAAFAEEERMMLRHYYIERKAIERGWQNGWQELQHGQGVMAGQLRHAGTALTEYDLHSVEQAERQLLRSGEEHAWADLWAAHTAGRGRLEATADADAARWQAKHRAVTTIARVYRGVRVRRRRDFFEEAAALQRLHSVEVRLLARKEAEAWAALLGSWHATVGVVRPRRASAVRDFMPASVATANLEEEQREVNNRALEPGPAGTASPWARDAAPRPATPRSPVTLTPAAPPLPEAVPKRRWPRPVPPEEVWGEAAALLRSPLPPVKYCPVPLPVPKKRLAPLPETPHFAATAPLSTLAADPAPLSATLPGRTLPALRPRPIASA